MSPTTGNQPRVSIVIVAARNAERLLSCLERVVLEAPDEVALEIVVVLNAAEPGMEEALRSAFEHVQVVSSDVPLGFAGGVNLGASHTRGELLHVLHDDTEVEPGWLDRLIAVLEDRPEAGAVGSLVLGPDGSVQSAGAVLWRDGRTEAIAPRGREEQRSDAYPVDYCASASLLVRRDAWEAVGGLDERFHPAYYVDVDLAMALRSGGYATLCEPRSRVRHERGGSSRDAFRSFVSERNRATFVAKWAHDLTHQAPYADGAEARSRAVEATAARARAVVAARRPPTGGSIDRPPPDPETAADRLRREREQLLREIAVKDAYVAELERIAATERTRRADELADAAETRRRLEADGAIAQQALVEAHAELWFLRDRVRTLNAIEAGGWWRLRSRLLGLRTAGGRLRRLIRRAGTSRTG
ncbi:MAG: glycosyltransferase family 2 protein [Actinomycetota bacterium]|nr:glycosyltransferase family 2 protein [Actinomycetota bacterium]